MVISNRNYREITKRCIVSYVGEELSKVFKAHYFQLVTNDLKKILQEMNTFSNISRNDGNDCKIEVYNYLYGITVSSVEYIQTQYMLCNIEELFQKNMKDNEQNGSFMHRTHDFPLFHTWYNNDEIMELVNLPIFVDTLNNFIEYEKKKYGIISEKSICESTETFQIEWKDE